MLADPDLPLNEFGTPSVAGAYATVLNNLTDTYHRRRRWNMISEGGDAPTAKAIYNNSAVMLGLKPKDSIFQQGYYLPPGVKIEIEFVRSINGFSVVGNGATVIAVTSPANSGLQPDLRLVNNTGMRFCYHLKTH